MRTYTLMIAAGLLATTAACTQTTGYPNPQYGYYNNNTAYNNGYAYNNSRYANRQARSAYGDYDRDGIPNRYDRDANGDGVPDRYRR